MQTDWCMDFETEQILLLFVKYTVSRTYKIVITKISNIQETNVRNILEFS